MRFTLDTDASTLTHPVQLCLVAIPMIVPSTYRKRTHFPSSKTVTSGYDSLRKGRDIGGRGAVFEQGEVDIPVVNGDEYVLVTVHRFDGKTSRQVGRRPFAPVGSEGKAF